MWLVIALAALPLVQPAVSAQQPGQVAGEQSKDENLLSIRQIKLASFKPQNLDARELTILAQQLIGRQFYVVENGGFDSAPVQNMHFLGSTIVLYDLPENLERMLPTLDELDRAGADPDPVETVAKEFQTWEYGPRHLSLESVLDVLRPLQRTVFDVSNLSVSHEQRLLVVRDRPERIAEIKALIERVDVPQDQVSITCWLLQGGTQEGSGAALPAELAEHLKRLLPGQTFQPAGFGMLQVTVSTQRPISLQMGPGVLYQLELQPTAFDRQSGSLTAGSCTLTSLMGNHQLFSTAVVLRGGAYTVIGASGAQPMLVAVLVRPVEK